MKRTLWQIAISVRAVYGVNLTAHSNEAPHSKKRWDYSYVDYPIANTYEADPMADSHSCQSSVWSEPYGTQQRSTPQQKTPMKLTLWQIAIAVRAVYRVNLTAHSNEAPHSKKLWGYSYVDYPIANTYEADPMADSHSCQSSVWNEPYGTQQRSTPQQKTMGLSLCQLPHSKHL